MKTGDTFYLRKGMPGDPLYKCHVVAVVDECMVVYKWYGRRKHVKEATEEYGVPVLSVERGASFNDPHIGKQKEIDYE